MTLAYSLAPELPGGAVVLVGLSVEPPAFFDVPWTIGREASVESVSRCANIFDRGANLVATSKLDLKPLMTGVFEFKDGIEAIVRARDGREAADRRGGPQGTKGAQRRPEMMMSY